MQIQPKRSQEPQSLNFTRPSPSLAGAFIVSTLETVLGPFFGQDRQLLPRVTKVITAYSL